MTLEEESVYFFQNQLKESLIFDVKDYLIALGCSDTNKIQEYKTEYGRIEEEYVSEWVEALLPYFKSNKSVPYTGDSNNDNNLNYMEQSKDNWVGEPRVLTAFHECLKGIGEFQTIQPHLNNIFPMICQVIDDYRAIFKIKGVQLMTEFLRLVPSEIVNRFNLNHVIYESLKVNISFESDELVEKSIDLWIGLIGKVETFPAKEFLKRSDELLLLICRDVGTTSKLNRKVLLLKAIGSVVELMQFTSIRFLRKIVTSLCEAVREDFTNDSVLKAGEDAMIVVIKNCWIRMDDEKLKEMVLGTFGGNVKIENLFKI